NVHVDLSAVWPRSAAFIHRLSRLRRQGQDTAHPSSGATTSAIRAASPTDLPGSTAGLPASASAAPVSTGAARLPATTSAATILLSAPSGRNADLVDEHRIHSGFRRHCAGRLLRR